MSIAKLPYDFQFIYPLRLIFLILRPASPLYGFQFIEGNTYLFAALQAQVFNRFCLRGGIEYKMNLLFLKNSQKV
jgi:hypothetical protein